MSQGNLQDESVSIVFEKTVQKKNPETGIQKRLFLFIRHFSQICSSLLFNCHAQVVKHKGIFIGQLLDHFCSAAGTVPGAGFDPDENRIFSLMFFLQCGDEFEGVGGDYAVVMIGCGDQGGGIGGSFLDVVER